MPSPPPANRDCLRLPDGRRLFYSVAGPRDGTPVVYCHGAIGTPLERSVALDSLARELGIRYVAISRPAVGGSDPAPGRTIRGFASDVQAVADSLGLVRFAVVGVSAGAPYALAVAHELAGRVTRVAACSPLSPLCALHRTPGLALRVRLALGALTLMPRTLGALGDAAMPVVRHHPGLVSGVILAHAAPAERERLRAPDERRAASESFLTAAAGGVSGLIADYLLYTGDWGFTPAAIAAEVHLWHGFRDPLVPIDHALALALSLRRCRVFFDPDEGHHFFRRRLAEILAVLVGVRPHADAHLERSLEGVRALAARRGSIGD
ncbi:MAG TPA: alpha/beta hydrolase [Solirubrobacteraceae bacterium]|jgi:pimeloyl-ACP methyl ester carboxylesterase|nr:alpha/beta hydrolase [Solirubrobacteraceae bacterium]